jgi:hypothetical protein
MEVKRFIQLVEDVKSQGFDEYRLAAEIAQVQKEEDAQFIELQGYPELANLLRLTQ